MKHPNSMVEEAADALEALRANQATSENSQPRRGASILHRLVSRPAPRWLRKWTLRGLARDTETLAKRYRNLGLPNKAQTFERTATFVRHMADDQR